MFLASVIILCQSPKWLGACQTTSTSVSIILVPFKTPRYNLAFSGNLQPESHYESRSHVFPKAYILIQTPNCVIRCSIYFSHAEAYDRFESFANYINAVSSIKPLASLIEDSTDGTGKMCQKKFAAPPPPPPPSNSRTYIQILLPFWNNFFLDLLFV